MNLGMILVNTIFAVVLLLMDYGAYFLAKKSKNFNDAGRRFVSGICWAIALTGFIASAIYWVALLVISIPQLGKHIYIVGSLVVSGVIASYIITAKISSLRAPPLPARIAR